MTNHSYFNLSGHASGTAWNAKVWLDADAFTEKVTEKYPDVDVDAQFGGQPIYYYVLAVE